MRTPVLAVMALALGLAAAGGTYYYITTSKPQDPEFDVVVAKEDVKANTILKKDLFVVVKKKKSELGENFERYVREGEKTEGINMDALTTNRRSRNEIKKGRAIHLDADTDDTGPQGLQSKLKEGEWAFTVQTNPNDALAGLLRPGMLVDIIVNFKDPNTKEDRVVILFENPIEILAVNMFESAPPENQPMPPERVTLRMKSHQDAMRLKYFRDFSKVSLALPHKPGEDAKPRFGLHEREYAPKKDPIFASTTPPEKEETPEPAPPSPSSPNGKKPIDNKPSEPDILIVDRTLRIFDGVGVSEHKHELKIKREKKQADGAQGSPGAAPANGVMDESKKETPKKEPDQSEDPTREDGESP